MHKSSKHIMTTQDVSGIEGCHGTNVVSEAAHAWLRKKHLYGNPHSLSNVARNGGG